MHRAGNQQKRIEAVARIWEAPYPTALEGRQDEFVAPSLARRRLAGDREPVLSAMSPAETCDALVVSD
jgi:hypothetical protein